MNLPIEAPTPPAEASLSDARPYRRSLSHAYVNALGQLLKRVVNPSNEDSNRNVYLSANGAKTKIQPTITSQ